jgi:hypothetical protein
MTFEAVARRIRARGHREAALGRQYGETIVAGEMIS